MVKCHCPQYQFQYSSLIYVFCIINSLGIFHSVKAKDKLVVYNQPWTGYVDGYYYRTQGAAHAANVGAKATLIRSVTDFSIYSPHTGSQVCISY